MKLQLLLITVLYALALPAFADCQSDCNDDRNTCDSQYSWSEYSCDNSCSSDRGYCTAACTWEYTSDAQMIAACQDGCYATETNCMNQCYWNNTGTCDSSYNSCIAGC